MWGKSYEFMSFPILQFTYIQQQQQKKNYIPISPDIFFLIYKFGKTRPENAKNHQRLIATSNKFPIF